jgi:hypothetical protein
MPTPTPLPGIDIRRPEAIAMYPDVPSKVVRAHHGGAWAGEALVPGALRHMLDASITELTGLNGAHEAWSALFAPDERVAIKVNTIRSSSYWTHVPLVTAVTECLQEAGIPAEQIVIFDRATNELKDAGYEINKDSPGVRCYGTGTEYSGRWTANDRDVEFSNVLLSCHALINMPTLKQHGMGGISFAMKNHYGSFNRPRAFHSRIWEAIPKLNALSPIRDRTRLVIGDALTITKRGWHAAATGDSILMSYDPVAHDAIGLQVYEEAMNAEEIKVTADRNTALLWLEKATELGLGTHNPDDIDLKELALS